MYGVTYKILISDQSTEDMYYLPGSYDRYYDAAMAARRANGAPTQVPSVVAFTERGEVWPDQQPRGHDEAEALERAYLRGEIV